MRLWVNHTGEVSIREQLVTQVVLAILCKELLPGQRLPSTRDLARRFNIHANTASAAYRELEREGWVEFRHGSGVYLRHRGVAFHVVEEHYAEAGLPQSRSSRLDHSRAAQARVGDEEDRRAGSHELSDEGADRAEGAGALDDPWDAVECNCGHTVNERGRRGVGIGARSEEEFHRCARLSQSREIGYPHRKKALESRGSRGEATMKIE